MITDYIDKDKIIQYLDEHLSEKRRRHIRGVVDTAVRLAEQYGADPEKAEAGALYHDMFKERDLDDLIDFYGLPQKYKGNRNLAHSKVAAAAMEKDFHVADRDLINAVSYHTTGRPAMSLLEKILFLADAIEPSRDYPGVDEARRLAYKDIDRACLYSLSRSVEYVRSQGEYLDEDTLHARDYYRNQLKERKMDSRTLAIEAAKAMDAKLGIDVVIIDVAERSSFTDYLVVVSGSSERQAEALADAAEDRLAELDVLSLSTEGRRNTGWILVDFGDIVVNVFTEEMRAKYNIEGVWGDCDLVDWK